MSCKPPPLRMSVVRRLAAMSRIAHNENESRTSGLGIAAKKAKAQAFANVGCLQTLGMKKENRQGFIRSNSRAMHFALRTNAD
jgi:hypothetical protein